MRSPLGRIVFVDLLLCFLLLETSDFAQSEKPEATNTRATTRVTLGNAYGVLGSSVVVPISFTPAEGLEVGRIKLEVRFVNPDLKFLKIDRGVAAELAEVDLRAEIRIEKNEEGVETSTVTVLAAFLSPEPPAKGIPAGLLGYLALKADAAGQPATIVLRPTAEATELRTNRPVRNLQALETTVEIVAPASEPMINCFFFSH